MILSYASLEHRAKRGKERLEAVVPEWRDMVDWTQFDISSMSYCILAQIFGNYFDGLRELKIPLGSDYGFDLNSWDYEKENKDNLNKIWLKFACE